MDWKLISLLFTMWKILCVFDLLFFFFSLEKMMICEGSVGTQKEKGWNKRQITNVQESLIGLCRSVRRMYVMRLVRRENFIVKWYWPVEIIIFLHYITLAIFVLLWKSYYLLPIAPILGETQKSHHLNIVRNKESFKE